MELSGTLQVLQKLNGTLTKQQGLEGNLSNEVLRGYSAYQVAVLNGFEGTEEEWLESLKADPIGDLSAYFYEKNEVDAKFQEKGNYLTEIPSEYVTENELNAKGYLTEHQSLDGYAKTSDIPTKVSQLTNDKGYLTEHQSLEGYAKKSDIPTDYAKSNHTHSQYLTQHQSLDAYAKKTDIPSLDGYALKNEIPSLQGYATEKYVNDAISNIDSDNVDLSGYYTKEEVNNLFNSIVNGNEVEY